jgi:hypothetical protein
MLNSKYIRVAVVVVAFAVLVLSSGATPQTTEAVQRQQAFTVIAPDSSILESFTASSPPENDRNLTLESSAPSPDPLSSTSTFYSVREDRRRCLSPLCGGYFVKRVNLPLTRCPNGRYLAECYVAEIDWNGQAQVEPGEALLRGSMVAKTYGRFGNLGLLRVSESWQSVSENQPTGTFYRVRDRGLRCITYPCPTHHEAKLNSTVSQNIAGVDLTGASLGTNNAPVVLAAMTGPDAAIIVGNNVAVSGPGGRLQELKATHVYYRAKPESAMKPCMKTGCSSQVCTDHNVITTCEWRPEYECYRKATCERQADGNCGFTKTRELTSCLAAK